MAIKRAAPPKSQDQRNPSPKSSVPSSAQKDGAEKLVSIPNDMVLAPQVEAPRQPTGRDQSRHKSTGVVELSWAEFDRKVQQLARTIRQAWEPQAVVGVAHGGVYVGGALAGALGCRFYPVRISRRSRDRVKLALLAMGREELKDLLEKEGQAEATCQFCTTRYVIPGAEIQQMLTEGSA